MSTTESDSAGRHLRAAAIRHALGPDVVDDSELDAAGARQALAAMEDSYGESLQEATEAAVRLATARSAHEVASEAGVSDAIVDALAEQASQASIDFVHMAIPGAVMTEVLEAYGKLLHIASSE